MGRQTVPRRDSGEIPQVVRAGLRSGAGNHSLLRSHRRHDRRATRGDESRRRGHHFRALLRKLRSRCIFVRCGTQTGSAFGLPIGRFDPDELRRAFSSKTKAIILNSPNNPTGKVFTRAELEVIADLCQEFDTLAITDEIYEHILYDGASHIPIATLPGMRERTVLVNSMSKTYSVTGWRVGFVLAAPDLTDSIRKVHDFLTVGAAAPLQQAGVVALNLPDSYYEKLSVEYQKRRDLLLERLEEAGFRCFRPQGAYYIMTDIGEFGFSDDVSFVRHLIENSVWRRFRARVFFQILTLAQH